MSGTTRAAAQTAQSDSARLKYCGVTFWGVPDQNYADQDIPKALQAAGIVGFNSDFIGLAEVDIDALIVPADPVNNEPAKKPRIMDYRRLKALLAYFHDRSRKIKNGHISIASATKANFEAYLTGSHRPDQPIIPHNVPLPDQDDEALNNWRKHVKPNEKAFKPFKDEATWMRTKDQIKITLNSQNLSHVIDESHTVTNPRLDTAQQEWFYKVLDDIMITPRARTVVMNNKDTRDCRDIWKQLCAAIRYRGI